MLTSSIQTSRSQYYFIASYILLFGILSLLNVKYSLLLLVLIFCVVLFNERPQYALYIIIVSLPFAGTVLLNHKVVGLPGLKFTNVFVTMALLFYLKSKYGFRYNGFGMWLMLGSIFLLATSIIRSLPYLNEINYYNMDNLNTTRYFLSNFIKPIFYLVPLFIIVSYCKSKKTILFFVNAIILSLVLSSLVLIIFGGPAMLHIGTGRQALNTIFGVHSNNLSTYYMIGYPFVLARFVMKRDLFGFSALILVLAGVGIGYSRTAYMVVIFSTLLFLLMEKNKKWIPYIFIICIIFILISPASIVDRSMKGISEGDINKISAGRVYNIWVPVLDSIGGDPVRTIFGSGRFSVIFASQVERGHPHNMYLEALLDTGVVGLLFFCGTYGILMKRIKKGIEHEEDYQLKIVLKAVLISIVAFLISGLTGRHFFPDLSNSLLWVTAALGLTILKFPESGRMYPHG